MLLTCGRCHHATDIEDTHNKFCRFVLKVGKSTPICCVLGDRDRLRMHILLTSKEC